MIDAKLRAGVRMALRTIYFRSPARLEALKRTETATPASKLDGSPKERQGKRMFTRRYKCESCGKDGLKTTEVQINHKENCGGSPGSRDTPEWWTWDILIERLFCSSDKLEVLCVDCHSAITKTEKEAMRDGSFYEKIKDLYVK